MSTRDTQSHYKQHNKKRKQKIQVKIKKGSQQKFNNP